MTAPAHAGRIALDEGRWAAARTSFAAALAHEESPEAHEGLSWAAWWLDDGPAVLAARERAYRLYRERGDRTGAARMAMWLAVDQLDFRGEVAVASGWLHRAHRLLEGVATAAEHGWLAFHQGYLSHLGGDSERAVALARSAAGVGRRCAVGDLEMLGLALEGATLVACARVPEGMRCLDEAAAAALAGEATIPISGAWTCCFLVSACASVRDFERAFAWCDRIAEFAERHGSRYMLAFCRGEYGAVHLWRGRWPEAERALEASVEDFRRSRPTYVGAPLAGLAELRRRQGRLHEAEALAERARPSMPAQLCHASVALDRGDARQAAELLERVLRSLPRERRVERAPALELLVRARAEMGELDAAGAALADLRDAARLAGTPAMAAGADLAAAGLEAAAGHPEHARPLCEDAVDAFERCGAPYEAARARAGLAASLLALGRRGDARREAMAARAALAALGAPLGRVQQVLDATTGAGGPASVTRREREVLALLADGLTNQQIADRLVVSEHTVHRHLTNIMRKLDAPSRAAAATRAVRSGLIGPPA